MRSIPATIRYHEADHHENPCSPFPDDRRRRDGAAKANRKTGEGEWRRIERQVGCGALLKTGVVALT